MKKKFSAILTGAFLILFCMVMSVTVNAAQKTPGRVKMVSAYSLFPCLRPSFSSF